MIRLAVLILATLASRTVSAAQSDGFDFPLGPPDGDGYEFRSPNGTAFLELVDYKKCGRVPHPGEDWNAIDGTDANDPVYAAGNGTIEYAELHDDQWGFTVLIRHDGTFGLPGGGTADRVWSWYGHMASIGTNPATGTMWANGDQVKRGDQIGTVGDFPHGMGEAFHLHFEIRRTLLTYPWSFPCTAAQRETGWITARYLPPSEFIKLNRYERVSASLVAAPTTGVAPLIASVAAQVGGTAKGTINYTFYCNRSDSGTDVTHGWAAKFDGTAENPKFVLNACTYESPGTYTAKVIVERGMAQPTEDRVQVSVTSPTACSPDPRLALPYDDVGHCPFECCVYGSWFVESDTPVHAAQDVTSRVIATLRRGERVDVATGVVITRAAGAGRMPDNRCQKLGVRSGECVTLLDYVGEGYWKLWKDGQVIGECELYPPDVFPISDWWVGVAVNGDPGWVLYDDGESFCGSDKCGGPCPRSCGNGTLDEFEECDGNDDAACPGRCSYDCRCEPDIAYASSLVCGTFSCSSRLYTVDPVNGGVDREIGRIRGEDGSDRAVLDVAVSPTGDLYGLVGIRSFLTVSYELHYIAKESAISVKLGSPLALSKPAALTFARDGTLYAATDEDVGRLVKINRPSVTVSEVGPLGSGFSVSGDLAFDLDGALYAIVRERATENDILARIDRAAGAATRIGTDIGFDNVLGLTFVSGRLLGFTTAAPGCNGGALIEINRATGRGLMLRCLTFNASGADSR